MVSMRKQKIYHQILPFIWSSVNLANVAIPTKMSLVICGTLHVQTKVYNV